MYISIKIYSNMKNFVERKYLYSLEKGQHRAKSCWIKKIQNDILTNKNLSKLRSYRILLQFTHLALFTLFPIHQCWTVLTPRFLPRAFAPRAPSTYEMPIKSSSSSVCMDQFSLAIIRLVSASIFCYKWRKIGSFFHTFQALTKYTSAL